jgi:hypothetical protein
MAMAGGLIVKLTVAMLVQSGHTSWNKSYKAANCDSRLDSLSTIKAFGSFGRKANKKDYYVYRVSGSTFTQVAGTVTDANAVEFRFWSTDLEADMLTPTSFADKYALFYLDDGKLKLDIGTSTGGSTGGAINASGYRVTGGGVTTVTLASHVTNVQFGHTVGSGSVGNGCVRMKLLINDPADNQSKTFLAATFIRNVWPQ